MYTIDFESSLFYNDILVWDDFSKRKHDHPGYFFPRVMCSKLREDTTRIFRVKGFY
jgi:hypothetical protein